MAIIYIKNVRDFTIINLWIFYKKYNNQCYPILEVIVCGSSGKNIIYNLCTNIYCIS